MTETIRKNFSKGKLSEFNPETGDRYIRCNFTQLTPGTLIAEAAGIMGLYFERCNMVNCLVPDGSTLVRCNTTQISRCTNLTPAYIDQGIPECEENCQHVTEVDTLDLGGDSLEIYHYEDKVL